MDYSARFALGLFFDAPIDLGVDWTTSYISNHPIFRWAIFFYVPLHVEPKEHRAVIVFIYKEMYSQIPQKYMFAQKIF